MNSPHGVVALLKPPGMTSHDAVAHVRRVLRTKRVGHTGTLDPAAAGVLLICVGQATRLVEALQTGSKGYLAEATFGYETDTCDAVGETVRECDASDLTREQLERALSSFRGVIDQQPPMHSAVKVGGRKLYEIARENRDDELSGEIDRRAAVEIPTRSVTISALDVTRFFPAVASASASAPHNRPRALLQIECSGGTYIRSLVRDIGHSLNGAATMTFLTRLHNGSWRLPDAVTPQEFERAPKLVPLTAVLQKLYGQALIDDDATMALSQGRIVSSAAKGGLAQKESITLWSNREGTLLALSESQQGPKWKPIKVFDLREAGASKAPKPTE